MINHRKLIFDHLYSKISGILVSNGYPVDINLVIQNRVLPPGKVSWRYRTFCMLVYDGKGTTRDRNAPDFADFGLLQFSCYACIRNGTVEEMYQLMDSIEQAITLDPQPEFNSETFKVREVMVVGDEMRIPEEIDEDLADGENRTVESRIRLQVEYDYLPWQIATGN